MNTVTVARPTASRQPQIVVAMNEAGLSAYQFGYLDAELGYPFAPEMYFVRQSDMLEYTEGFEAVRGVSDITRSFKRRHGGLVTDADIERAQAAGERDEAAHRFASMLTAMIGEDEMQATIELADLQEGMADNEFWATGQW